MTIDSASIVQKVIELKMYQNCDIQCMKKLLIRLTEEYEAPGTQLLYDIQGSMALKWIK